MNTSPYLGFQEVVSQIDEPEHVLRYWLEEISLVQPQKSLTGKLHFSARDVEFLHRIKYLVRQRGYTLSGAEQSLLREDSWQDADIVIEYRESRRLLQQALATVQASRRRRDAVLERCNAQDLAQTD